MRFNDFASLFKPFKVTVRLQHEKSTITTICFCDSASNIRKMLAELFGKNNVMSVSEIVSESLQSDQIQREAAIRPQAVQRQAPHAKNALIQPSSVSETKTKTRVLSPQELQVKALADKAEDYKQQEKALKARQQMAKAQQNLMKASRPKPSI